MLQQFLTFYIIILIVQQNYFQICVQLNFRQQTVLSVDLILEKYRIQKYCIGKSSNREIYVTQTVVFSYFRMRYFSRIRGPILEKHMKNQRNANAYQNIFPQFFAILFRAPSPRREDVGWNRDVHLFKSCFEAHAYAPVTKTRGCGYGKCAR